MKTSSKPLRFVFMYIINSLLEAHFTNNGDYIHKCGFYTFTFCMIKDNIEDELPRSTIVLIHS